MSGSTSTSSERRRMFGSPLRRDQIRRSHHRLRRRPATQTSGASSLTDRYSRPAFEVLLQAAPNPVFLRFTASAAQAWVPRRLRRRGPEARIGSARPDEGVTAFDLDEVGVDRCREVELHRVIHGVVLRGLSSRRPAQRYGRQLSTASDAVAATPEPRR